MGAMGELVKCETIHNHHFKLHSHVVIAHGEIIITDRAMAGCRGGGRERYATANHGRTGARFCAWECGDSFLEQQFSVIAHCPCVAVHHLPANAGSSSSSSSSSTKGKHYRHRQRLKPNKSRFYYRLTLSCVLAAQLAFANRAHRRKGPEGFPFTGHFRRGWPKLESYHKGDRGPMEQQQQQEDARTEAVQLIVY